jgi:hypothetical protein
MTELLASSNFWLGIGAGSVAIGFIFFLILYSFGSGGSSDVLKHRQNVFKIIKSLNAQNIDNNPKRSEAVRSFGVLGFFIMVIGACAMTYGGYLFFWGR